MFSWICPCRRACAYRKKPIVAHMVRAIDCVLGHDDRHNPGQAVGTGNDNHDGG